ncbi:MAG: hypothetical protein KR126chlam3_00477 [Chlamydiae bacterium]|nr:hypothetical protein [Chlamydiota bacterium]
MPAAPACRHARFAPDQVSGSHRPPAAFRKSREPEQSIAFLLPVITPFDHWAIGQLERNQPKKDITQLDRFGIRLTASWTAIKSLAYVIIKFVQFIFCFCSKQDLSDQWQGLKSSLHAIYSPSEAIRARSTWIQETSRTWLRGEVTLMQGNKFG